MTLLAAAWLEPQSEYVVRQRAAHREPVRVAVPGLSAIAVFLPVPVGVSLAVDSPSVLRVLGFVHSR